jgi:hypothetical protein
MSKTVQNQHVLNFGHWDLFDNWDLLFGIYTIPALHLLAGTKPHHP